MCRSELNKNRVLHVYRGFVSIERTSSNTETLDMINLQKKNANQIYNRANADKGQR